MPTFSSLAEQTNDDATELEEDYRALALGLFALELATINAAISRAASERDIVRALQASVLSYRLPRGEFRQRWESRFTELLTESAVRQESRPVPTLTGPRLVPSLPPAVTRRIDTQAEELAVAVTEVSATRMEAVARVVGQEVTDRRAGTAPAPIAPARQDQRLETLVPLIGRDTAVEVMKVIHAGRAGGQSIAKVAQAITQQVNSIEVRRRRADTIARTETIGLVNMTEYERALSTGVLKFKRQITQGDNRVRESHDRNERQGWIPITQRYQNGLMYPGERPAPAEEVIGCRCSEAFSATGEGGTRAAPLPPLLGPGSGTVTTPKPPEQVSMLAGGKRDTLTEHMINNDPNNPQFTPERQAIHDRIVAEYFSRPGVKPVENPAVFLMGGGAASGKSAMQKQLQVPSNLIKVDVDEIRQHLPEYKAEQARAKAAGESPNELLAAYTHEEASILGKRISYKAADEKYNMLVDGVGDSGIDKLQSKVLRYKQGGASVTANYITLDYDVAYARMRKRGDTPGPNFGRYVPAATMRFQHADVARTFRTGIERGLFEEFTLWDNTVAGQPPVKVAEGRGTRVTIYRQDLWDEFVKRGEGIAPRPGEK